MPSDRLLSRFSHGLGAAGLRWTGKLNVPVYRLSGGRIGSKVGRAPVLLLTTTGRRTGERRVAPVVYLDADAGYVVIDTNAGNEKLPGWSHNLAANPDAEVEIGRERQSVRARVATGEERDELWRRANSQYAGFDEYVKTLRREPSVWVLEPS